MKRNAGPGEKIREIGQEMRVFRFFDNPERILTQSPMPGAVLVLGFLEPVEGIDAGFFTLFVAIDCFEEDGRA